MYQTILSLERKTTQKYGNKWNAVIKNSLDFCPLELDNQYLISVIFLKCKTELTELKSIFDNIYCSLSIDFNYP